MLLPFLLLLGLGATAAGFALYERGHGQDPHGLSVAETLKMHWQVMWHHQQAAAASDPAIAAAQLAAAQQMTMAAAPSVQKAATTASDDFSRARAVALSDLMAANGHLTAVMAELVQAKEDYEKGSALASAIGDATWAKIRRRYDDAKREVDGAIANVHDKTAVLTRLGVRVPGAHA